MTLDTQKVPLQKQNLKDGLQVRLNGVTERTPEWCSRALVNPGSAMSASTAALP